MKKKLFLTLAVVFFLSQSVFAITAEEIIDKSEDLPTPDTAMTTMEMKIYKGSKVQDKEFEILSKKYPEDENRTLVSFIKPTKIKLLTHAHKGKDDDQWLMLSSGKVKRIASTDKGKSFVNSHFCYEDLSSREKDDYNYTLLGEESVDGEPCYKIEATQKNGNKIYDKTIVYVRKADYFGLKVDFYQNGQLYKYLQAYEVKEVNGIKTPNKVVMALADGKGKTELLLKEVQYNSEIKDRMFNKEALR